MVIIKSAFILFDNEKFQLKEVISFKTYITYLLVFVIYILLMSLGFLLLIIPGAIIMARLTLATYITIDKDMGPIQSLKRSWEITKGSALKLFIFEMLFLTVMSFGSYYSLLKFESNTPEYFLCLFAMSIYYVIYTYALMYIFRKLDGELGWVSIDVPEPKPLLDPNSISIENEKTITGGPEKSLTGQDTINSIEDDGGTIHYACSEPVKFPTSQSSTSFFRKLTIVPLIIFVLLCSAWFFRWETVATKTYDSGVLKWDRDRWSGSTWAHLYSVEGNAHKEIEPGWLITTNATYIWIGALLIDGVWLALAYRKDSAA
jgi:hypothetical protein